MLNFEQEFFYYSKRNKNVLNLSGFCRFFCTKRIRILLEAFDFCRHCSYLESLWKIPAESV